MEEQQISDIITTSTISSRRLHHIHDRCSGYTKLFRLPLSRISFRLLEIVKWRQFTYYCSAADVMVVNVVTYLMHIAYNYDVILSL